MATLNDMVDEVRSSLAGYTMRQDRITYLANTGVISSTGVHIQVGSSSNLAKGVIEIDDELFWIDSFDKNNNTMRVAPGFGRGYQNTVPTSHAQSAQVTLSPTFPRNTIKRAINDTILSVFPKLWAISSTTFTFNPAKNTYSLPDDAETVLAVSWQTVGPSEEWMPVRRWRVDPMANSTSFNSNNSISIYDSITPGRTVQVWYTAEPNQLTSNNDEFSDVSGLPESARDVITMGASWRLLSFLDAGRINLTSAESDNADTKLPSNAGMSASKYVYAIYNQRLADEAAKLSGKFPIKLHYNR
jgi:hypothetical protein